MKPVKVEGHINLIKDIETGAVLSTKSGDYEQYMHLKNVKEQQSRKLDYVYDEILKLKNEISEIKNMIGSIMYESKWYRVRKHE